MKNLLLLIILIMVSCNSNTPKKEISKPDTKEPALGTYIYLDNGYVLHTKNGCKAVFKNHNMQAVRPIPVEDVSEAYLKRVCSQCVTEEQLSILHALIAAKGEVTDSVVDEY